MKRKSLRNFWMLVSVCVLSVAFAGAQYQPSGGHAGSRSMGKHTTVTGCLQKGDEANEYSITDNNGKTYGLRSSKVDLSMHVGHKVSVTGMLKPESTEKGEPNEANEANGKKEAGDIRVSSLKMISTSCQ